MGEGCRSWFPQRQFNPQSPNLNSLAAPHPLVQQSTNPQFINTGSIMASIAGTLPDYANPEIPYLQVGQVKEPRGWFDCLPRFQQGLSHASVLNASLRLQFPANPYENLAEKIISNEESDYAQKRFLVFDQSGDQTTLIFSSAIGTPIKGTSGGLKSPVGWKFNDKDPITKVNPNLYSEPVSTNMFDENGTDAKSEMHEDTEELNALLYSDDDIYFTDVEVTSLVHSPSTMTVRDEQFEGGTEKVDSSSGLTKRRKLLDGSNDSVPLVMDTTSSVFGGPESSSGNKRTRLVDKIPETLPLLMDTAISVNPNRCSEYEDDADSSCVNDQNPVSGDANSSTGYKRMRIDKIRMTVGVLRSLIPSGEGKDAIMVLDETIDYLKSLKLKAKAFGLNTL
ncbi:transcription factor bHLH143-like [Hibiscus syriacus]|uniref:transcription factor bHLH143-like n=1 Tax=Hibiscus syriacus TaxID=106335 RepID=UPI001920CCD8|nr:transcription factor bHLH143-like [Hibiscus syriacus]